MFIFNWLFDKLGYMPKSACVNNVMEIESLDKPLKPMTKPRVVKKPTTRRTSTRKAK
jgi:hypothetical protein